MRPPLTQLEAMLYTVAALFTAYLVGTFPTAVMVGRAGGHDVRVEGSGNPGASNVYRLMGFGPALVVFFGDALKGALPTAVGLAVSDSTLLPYALGIAAVLGHVFPVWSRFKGGRGVATAAGMAIVVFPVVALVLAVVWLAIAKGLGRASLASLTIVTAFPFGAWIAGAADGEVAAFAALAVFVIARHAANLRRLIRGEELDLRSDRATAAGHETA